MPFTTARPSVRRNPAYVCEPRSLRRYCSTVPACSRTAARQSARKRKIDARQAALHHGRPGSHRSRGNFERAQAPARADGLSSKAQDLASLWVGGIETMLEARRRDDLAGAVRDRRGVARELSGRSAGHPGGRRRVRRDGLRPARRRADARRERAESWPASSGPC